MEAAGFAAAIVAFIDFSCKLVKGSRELYHSSTGTTTELGRIGDVVRDLKIATAGLNPSRDITSSNEDRHWEALLPLARGCNEVSAELTAILTDLERKEGNKAWRSLESKWKGLRKEGAIAELEKRLDRYRVQLLLRLQLIVQEKQTAVHAQLQAMKASDIFRSDRGLAELEKIHEAFTSLDTKLMTEFASSMRDEGQKQLDSMSEIRKDLAWVLQALEGVPQKTSADIRVLNRLYFDTMYSRFGGISNAEFETFRWLLSDDDDNKPGLGSDEDESMLESDDDESFSDGDQDEQRTARWKFQSWLEEGNGVFHLSGKAGSGKSTLMKCLCDDPRLANALGQWAEKGAEKLIFASFFFWKSGDADQKSLVGLYRSLLFEVLRQCPELIRTVFRDSWATADVPGARWESSPLRLEELQRAMEPIVDERQEAGDRLRRLRFCFFIDGLDEYEGDGTDHFQLARLLRRWASQPNVKICVSSRPHAEFLGVFDSELRIHLHELTRLDIKRFISGMLQREGVDDKIIMKSIAYEIQNRADGVFLWVCLAVRSLLDGQRHRYSEKVLRERARTLPQGLNALYRQMLGGVGPEDRKRADRLFLLILSDKFEDLESESMSLHMVSWLDDLDDPEFPFNLPLSTYSGERYEDRLETARYTLQGLTRGLLEPLKLQEPRFFDLAPKGGLLFSVRFFHLTVREYLGRPEALAQMRERARGFDVEGAAARLKLAEVKFVPEMRGAYYWLTMESAFRAPLSPRIADEYERVCLHHRGNLEFKHGSWDSFQEGMSMRSKIRHLYNFGSEVTQKDPSFIHLLAYSGQTEAVLDRVLADKSLLSQHGDGPSLLLTACLFDHNLSRENLLRQTQLVSELTQAGARVEEPFLCASFDSGADLPVDRKPIVTTVWALFLWILFHYSIYRRDDKLCHILEILLQGSPTVDIGVIIEPRYGYPDPGNAITCTLEELIIFRRPPNMRALLDKIHSLRDDQQIHSHQGAFLRRGELYQVLEVRVGNHTLSRGFKLRVY